MIPGRDGFAARERMTDSKRTDSVGGLLKHTSIYAIAPIFQRLLSLVLVGLYTKKLGTGEYGVIALVELFLTLLPILVGSNLVAGLSRFYFEQKDDRDRSSLISGTLILLISLAAAGASASYLGRNEIASWLVRSGDADSIGHVASYLAICCGIVPFALATNLGLETFQVEKRSKAVTTFALVKTVFEAALKLWFLYGLDMGVKGYLLGVLVGEIVAGTLMLAWVFRCHGARIVPRTLGPLVRYTIPLLPVGAFQLGLHRLDVALLSSLGPDEVSHVTKDGLEITVAQDWVGIYNLGYMIPMLFHAAAMASFMRIWLPNVFALRTDPEKAAHVRRVGTLVVLGIALAYGQVALFGREGVHLIAGQDSFHVAARVVPWIAFAYVFYALYALAQAALMKMFATGTLALINGLALGLNVALNLVLIPRYGYLGAAAATALSFAALALAATFAAGRRDLPPVSLRVAAKAVCLAALAAAMGVLLDRHTEAWSILALACKGTVTLAIVGLSFFALPREDRGAVIATVRHFLDRRRTQSA